MRYQVEMSRERSADRFVNDYDIMDTAARPPVVFARVRGSKNANTVAGALNRAEAEASVAKAAA